MSGLFEKDIRLIFQRKQTLAVFLVVAVIMSIAVDGSFIVAYLTMLSAIVAVSTLNYDEFDNKVDIVETNDKGLKDFFKQ